MTRHPHRTLEQFSKDYQYWYELSTISRDISYGFTADAIIGPDGHGITVTLRPPREQVIQPTPARYALTNFPSAAPVSDADPPDVAAAGELSRVHISAEHVAQLHAAFPQIFVDGNRVSRLHDWIWTPVCAQPALGEQRLPEGRSPTAPCVRVRDVILAEELTATLSGMNTEREIMEWLTTPARWLLHIVAPHENNESQPARSTSLQATNPAGAPSAIQDDRCPLPPMQMPAPTHFVSLTTDLPTMNRIFVTILCHDRPLPMILPPPLQNMLDMPFKARLTLDVVNTYLLTLLFGMLGAAVQVMRDIHRRLDDFTLTRVALSCYKVRLILGAVAGPFVGLFINVPSGVTSALTAEPQLTTRLTGLGLAFLAGFSVDLLFGVLERFTSLFSQVVPGSHASPQANQARVVNNRL